jgi:hypothetical protein
MAGESPVRVNHFLLEMPFTPAGLRSTSCSSEDGWPASHGMNRDGAVVPGVVSLEVDQQIEHGSLHLLDAGETYAKPISGIW